MHTSEVFLSPSSSSCGLCRVFFFFFHPLWGAREEHKEQKGALQRSTEEALRPLKRCRAICGEPRLILSRETRIPQNNADSTRFKAAISKVAQTPTKLGARLCEFPSVQFFFTRLSARIKIIHLIYLDILFTSSSHFSKEPKLLNNTHVTLRAHAIPVALSHFSLLPRRVWIRFLFLSGANSPLYNVGV